MMNTMLSIAKDAVDKDVTIKIGVSHNDQDRPPLKQDYSVVGPIIHCLPHGLQFRKPVSLSFGCNLHLAETDVSPNLQVLYRYVHEIIQQQNATDGARDYYICISQNGRDHVKLRQG